MDEIICTDDTIQFHNNGHMHRIGQPSGLYSNGLIKYCVNGETHNPDGPAVISGVFMRMEWHENGTLHRINGPAIVRDNGDMSWYFNGKRHRENGPAMFFTNGYMEWWINGENITEQVNEWMMENDIVYPFTDEEVIMFQFKFA